jgi:hypothetical protein
METDNFYASEEKKYQMQKPIHEKQHRLPEKP